MISANELLVEQLNDTRDWTLRLIADLEGEDWSFQPGDGQAHALWLCGHLACAQDTLIHVRCLESGVLDESFCSHFPLGVPVVSTEEHQFPEIKTVLETMAEVQAKTVLAVGRMTDDVLAQQAFGKNGTIHPHYRTKAGAVSHAVRHEAFHAGQIATIRRLRGKSFLR